MISCRQCWASKLDLVQLKIERIHLFRSNFLQISTFDYRNETLNHLDCFNPFLTTCDINYNTYKIRYKLMFVIIWIYNSLAKDVKSTTIVWLFSDKYLQKRWLKIYAEIDLTINLLFIPNFFLINVYIKLITFIKYHVI